MKIKIRKQSHNDMWYAQWMDEDGHEHIKYFLHGSTAISYIHNRLKRQEMFG